LTSQYKRGGRALLATVAALAASALAPAAAGAITVTVTGDDGSAAPLGAAVGIRNMSPHVTATPVAGEYYTYTITGPTGVGVSVPVSACRGLQDGAVDRTVDYAGNGVYTVNLAVYASTDQFCARAPIRTAALPFTIGASIAVAAPATPVLTRMPGSSITNTATLPINLNPGALSNDAFVAFNGQVGPDGALVGTSQQLFPDSSKGTVGVPLNKGPGNYVVVAHAVGFTGLNTPQTATPWSAPAIVKAIAPFDVRLSTTDTRGPSYRIKARINEPSASGRVSIAIARGTKSGRYRSYGSVKIRGHLITKRFTLRRTGSYRLRFKYKGNATVAPGFEVFKFSISRRFASTSAATAAAASLHR
jgi:hypothetical protein